MGPVCRKNSRRVKTKTEELRQKEGPKANQVEQMLTGEKRLKKNGGREKECQKKVCKPLQNSVFISSTKTNNQCILLNRLLTIFSGYLRTY